jgi:hypothetical protein
MPRADRLWSTYLPILASRPQIVQKAINGQMTDIEEFFFTDLIEFMVQGRQAGRLSCGRR